MTGMDEFKPSKKAQTLKQGHIFVGGLPEFTDAVRRRAHKENMSTAAFCRQAIQYAMRHMSQPYIFPNIPTENPSVANSWPVRMVKLETALGEVKQDLGRTLNDDFGFWTMARHEKYRSIIYGAYSAADAALEEEKGDG